MKSRILYLLIFLSQAIFVSAAEFSSVEISTDMPTNIESILSEQAREHRRVHAALAIAIEAQKRGDVRQEEETELMSAQAALRRLEASRTAPSSENLSTPSHAPYFFLGTLFGIGIIYLIQFITKKPVINQPLPDNMMDRETFFWLWKHMQHSSLMDYSDEAISKLLFSFAGDKVIFHR